VARAALRSVLMRAVHSQAEQDAAHRLGGHISACCGDRRCFRTCVDMHCAIQDHEKKKRTHLHFLERKSPAFEGESYTTPVVSFFLRGEVCSRWSRVHIFNPENIPGTLSFFLLRILRAKILNECWCFQNIEILITYLIRSSKNDGKIARLGHTSTSPQKGYLYFSTP